MFKFFVRTSSPENGETPFYVRLPTGYGTNSSRKLYRVLLFIPVVNGVGRLTDRDPVGNITRESGLFPLADQQGWFIVSPAFHQGKNEAHNRALSYYYPETFSGQAILNGLDAVQRKYPVATTGLLIFGDSGGAQLAHRFALWAADRVTAAVVNSSSWLDEPKATSRQVAWLLTVGEEDPAYNNMAAFVAQLREQGALPVFRSFAGVDHTRSRNSTPLELEFLKYYDDVTRPRLTARPMPPAANPFPPVTAAGMPYVGDAQDWNYYPNTPPNAANIPDESKVYNGLPTRPVAEAWKNDN